jgi:hypothetical protein
MRGRASGKKRLNGSSSASFPWSARRRISAAVKRLLTDAIGYEVSGSALEAVTLGQHRQAALEDRDRHPGHRTALERVGGKRVDGARERKVVADERPGRRDGRGGGPRRGRLAGAGGGERS